MKRSKRIETLDKRPVNLDGYINEWPEMGFVAMKSPYDPTPSVKVQDGKIVELDGKKHYYPSVNLLSILYIKKLGEDYKNPLPSSDFYFFI